MESATERGALTCNHTRKYPTFQLYLLLRALCTQYADMPNTAHCYNRNSVDFFLGIYQNGNFNENDETSTGLSKPWQKEIGHAEFQSFALQSEFRPVNARALPLEILGAAINLRLKQARSGSALCTNDLCFRIKTLDTKYLQRHL